MKWMRGYGTKLVWNLGVVQNEIKCMQKKNKLSKQLETSGFVSNPPKWIHPHVGKPSQIWIALILATRWCRHSMHHRSLGRTGKPANWGPTQKTDAIQRYTTSLHTICTFHILYIFYCIYLCTLYDLYTYVYIIDDSNHENHKVVQHSENIWSPIFQPHPNWL